MSRREPQINQNAEVEGTPRLKAGVIGPWGPIEATAPAQFNVVRNGLVPVAGVCLNLYLIYAAFFSALWAAPFRTGRSVVVICLALFAALLLSAIGMRLFRRALLTGAPPVSVDTTGR